MKSTLKTLSTAAIQWIAYLAALFQLRCLETHLADQCNALPYVVDVQLRADMHQSMRRLSGEVVEARNRVRAMRPGPLTRRSWRAA